MNRGDVRASDRRSRPGEHAGRAVREAWLRGVGARTPLHRAHRSPSTKTSTSTRFTDRQRSLGRRESAQNCRNVFYNCIRVGRWATREKGIRRPARCRPQYRHRRRPIATINSGDCLASVCRTLTTSLATPVVVTTLWSSKHLKTEQKRDELACVPREGSCHKRYTK